MSRLVTLFTSRSLLLFVIEAVPFVKGQLPWPTIPLCFTKYSMGLLVRIIQRSLYGVITCLGYLHMCPRSRITALFQALTQFSYQTVCPIFYFTHFLITLFIHFIFLGLHALLILFFIYFFRLCVLLILLSIYFYFFFLGCVPYSYFSLFSLNNHFFSFFFWLCATIHFLYTFFFLEVHMA
ncbi:hypothetical protein C2G38_42740 [Gigaspora rosea]|uniref:Uncharacterized protein n=1 Tax=Gigaspora rosea TaxID=44941 RepID=A0A397UPK6_9GLOM|nr:hypothetical protein C2G38_42740 [Gigaspora rosea]